MNFKGYFSTIKGKVNTIMLTFLALLFSSVYLLYVLHLPVDELREMKLKTQKSLKILNDLTFNGQKVIHHESKFKRNFTQKIEDFEHAVLEIADLRHYQSQNKDTSDVHQIVDKIFDRKVYTSTEEVLISDILATWEKVKNNFLLIRDQNTYKDSIIISYDPEKEYLLDENYVPGNDVVEASTNIIFKKHTHHLSTLNPELKKAWEYDDIYSQGLKNQLEKLFTVYEEEERSYEAGFDQSVYIISIILLIYFVAAYIFLHKRVYLPLNRFQYNTELAVDQLEYQSIHAGNKDLEAIQKLILKQQGQIAAASNFIESITNNDTHQTNIQVEGKLVEALTAMREKIDAVRKEENIRNWETKGMAEFSEILRTENKNIDDLCEKLIQKFIRYLEAVQGAIFLKTAVDNLEVLKLQSSYAYDRKKYLHKKIESGEGLVGQVWQEGASVYLSNVPEKHFSLKSGLGQGTPKYIFLAPIKDANDVFGVIELASIHPLEEYKRTFVEQVAITIASSISSVQLSEKTSLLLEQAQDMTQQMQLHEEEMRQNMEELQATQESALKREKEKDKELEQLKGEIQSLQERHAHEKEATAQLIEKLEKKAQHATVDNDVVKSLEAKIKKLQKEFDAKEQDLQETIKIKDMRIEKLRKKLNSN